MNNEETNETDANEQDECPACEVCGRTNVQTEPTDLGNGPVMCVLGQGCWVQSLEAERDAANARTEAAERALEACKAELRQVDKPASGQTTAPMVHFMNAADRAESEAAAQLTAANALLERWEAQAGGFGPVALYRDTRAHLSGQPAAPNAQKP